MPYPPWKPPPVQVCESLFHLKKQSDPPSFLKSESLNHISEHSSSYIIYTDGSKTNSSVGCSAVGVDREIGLKLPPNISNYSAELLAISKAIDLGNNSESPTIVIITDSKSSIFAIRKIYPENCIVQEIHTKLHASGKTFHLCWVPSHCGIPGNERADRLAKETSENLTVITHVKLPRSDLKATVKSKTKEAWRREWANIQDNKKLREITDSLTELPNSNCSDREWQIILCRLRIGHSRLTQSYHMTRSARPRCDFCGDWLEIKHILIECPYYEPKRNLYFPNTNRNMFSLLNSGDTRPRGPIYKFLSEINMLRLL